MSPAQHAAGERDESLEIRLLGPLRLRRSDGEAAAPSTAKGAALLALLVCEARPMRREHLMTLLWPRSPAERARRSLRVALSDLRRVLGGRIEAHRDTLRFLARAGDRIDLQVLRDWEAGRLPETALLGESVYESDELLQGLQVRDAPELETWLAAERARWSALCARFQLERAGALESAGRVEEAESVLRRALRLAPERESAHRRLIRLLARQGRYDEALGQFDACRAALESRLDVAPELATSLLGERVRAARKSARMRRPPRPPGPLIGREDELARLEAWLGRPERVVISVLGPGGIGKSRLALELAHRAERRYLEGVCLVPLAGHAADRPMEPAIAGALGLTLSSALPMREQLLDILASREMLLLLDNVEQLAAQRDLLSAMLDAAPELDLVVTSREALGLPEERRLPLVGLPVPPRADPEALASPSGAFALFRAAARRVSPDLALEEAGEAEAALRVCRLLEGTPLALELAAAWLDGLDCAALARAIETDLGVLDETAQGRPARHRGMRAVFDQSWSRLGPQERLALARLSVFRGGFDVDAAEQVAEADPATLRRLLAASLLHRVGAERFQVHELLRQFALERLAAAPAARADLERGHARYFLARFTRLSEGLEDADEPDRMAALRRDQDNLWAAWAWAVARRDRDAIAGCVLGLAAYHFGHGPNALGQRCCRDALRVLEGAGHDETDATEEGARADAALRALVLVALARLQHQGGQRAEAREAAERAIDLAEGLGEAGAVAGARARILRGILAREEGRYDEAREDFDDAMRLAERAGAERYAAEAAYQRAGIPLYQGDPERSLRETRAALERIRGTGHARLECSIHYTLGAILEQTGRFAEAKDEFRACLDTSLACGYRLGELMGRMSWGVMQGWAGELRSALENMRTALDLAGDVGHHVAERSVRCSAALLYADLGQRADAEHQARRALQQSREDGHRRDEGSALQRMARVQRMAHVHVEAAASAEAARAIFQELGEEPALAWLRAESGWIALGAGDLTGARRDLERAVVELGAHSPGLGLRFAELYLIELELSEARPEVAAPRADELREALRREGYAELEAAALTLAGWARLEKAPVVAAEAFRAALERRTSMGQVHLRLEPAAGLALSQARQGEMEAAARTATACLPAVDAGRFFGIAAPVRTLVALRDALAAAGDARADGVARAGERWLQERAAPFPTAEQRALFLRGSPARRALAAGLG